MWSLGRNNHSRGDTLVEVLVCIAIVSTILAGAFVVTGHSRQGVENAQEHAQAMKMLESQIEQLRASATGSTASPAIFTQAGSFCMSNGAVALVTSSSCNIGSAEPIFHLSITRTGTATAGYVFTANARWAQITNGYANEQLSYRLYND